MTSAHASLSAIPALVEEIQRAGKRTEGQVVKEIVGLLEMYGFRKPPEGGTRGFYVMAGQRKGTRLAGSDPGVPDLLVLTPERAYPIEVKPRDKAGRISAEQLAMFRAGCLHIVNSGEQVLRLLGLQK